MAKIDIRGAIVPDGEQWVYDWYGIPAVSPKRIMQQIERATANHDKELIVNINSPGGSVYAASEIYAHIKKFPGDSVAEITGVCASAASMPALATKRTVIAPVGAVMIHNASVVAQGDYREMESMKQLLIQTNEAIMQTYVAKTGKSEE
ncbi:MAG: Clp protease ClpP, partial [Lysinibacillus sp.]